MYQRRRSWLSYGFFAMAAINIALVIITVRAIETATRNVKSVPIVTDGNISVFPTPTYGIVATPVGVIREHKVAAVARWAHTVSRLETKEYDVVADAIKQRDPTWTIFGGESIQVHLEGTVIGRTDLTGLTISNDMRSGSVTISEDGKSISVILPAPEVTRPLLNESHSSFNRLSLGLFAATDPDLWQAAHALASQMLVEQACEEGIREQAGAETERQLTVLLQLGFQKVYVQTEKATDICGQESVP